MNILVLMEKAGGLQLMGRVIFGKGSSRQGAGAGARDGFAGLGG